MKGSHTQESRVPGDGPGRIDRSVSRRDATVVLPQAIETEVAEFLDRYRDARDDAGRRRMARNGHLPARAIQTGIGEVPVKPPARNREGLVRFTSSILPPYLRRSKAIEEPLPWLYLKGISTDEFGEALTALFRRDAPGLSLGTVSRLKAAWATEHKRWGSRSLQGRQYVYLWVDGIHFGVRFEEASCSS